MKWACPFVSKQIWLLFSSAFVFLSGTEMNNQSCFSLSRVHYRFRFTSLASNTEEIDLAHGMTPEKEIQLFLFYQKKKKIHFEKMRWLKNGIPKNIYCSVLFL